MLPIQIKNHRIVPALFAAPMAGITHSAFRRLLADFGGYGALFTEMLSVRALVRQDIADSPFTKKRDQEGQVFYQLWLSGEEDITAAVDKVSTARPFALDINIACPAPEITKQRAGAALFRDSVRLRQTIATVRSLWGGILTVKCRLGDDAPDWQNTFVERLRICEGSGIDAVFVHPRFFRQKLRRTARWDLLPWVCSQTSLPVIASGDIQSPADVTAHPDCFDCCAGIMIGRAAVVRPWIFREFQGDIPVIDHREIWERYYRYVLEDFPPEKAIGRIKEFSAYYAKNFFFGHDFFRAVQGAPDLQSIYDRALAFLSGKPRLTGYSRFPSGGDGCADADSYVVKKNNGG